MTTHLSNGYRLRPMTLEDLPEVVDALNAWSRRFYNVDDMTVTAFRSDIEEPGFDLERDTCLVIAPDGKVAAYYDVWDVSAPHVKPRAWGRIRPDHHSPEVQQALLEWIEQRSEQAIPLAPPEARVALHCYIPHVDEAAQAMFERSGYRLIRHSLRMVIDLDGPPPVPAWPEGITVRTLGADLKLEAVVQAVRDAFQDHWGYVAGPFDEELEHWRHRIATSPDYDPSLWFLAMDDGQIAGMSLCYPTTDDDPGMGWVGTLGVLRPWRRKGLGLALLYHSFQAFHQRGKPRAGLGVDAQSLTGATRLYLRAGMRPDPNQQWDLYEKLLRPGVDLTTQDVVQAVQA